MKLGVRYQTAYEYEDAVGFSNHVIRLFPRSDRFTRVRRFEFSTNDNANVRFGRDLFDNTIASCFYPERSRRLQFALELDLELEPRNPFEFILETTALNLPFAYDAAAAAVLAPYRTPQTSEPLPVPGWLPPTLDMPRPTVGTLVELIQKLHTSIGYERRDEGAALAPAETLRVGKGACRDVAVLLSEILRRLGLAARLASGYLNESGSEPRRAEGALHAWTEVYLPGAGWVGIDGTNGIFCNEDFICAAAGLMPADVTPIDGNYYHRTHVPARMSSSLQVVPL